jgi:phospholipid/cholesterol/gamma-HCH transport system permease protein
MVTLVRPAAKPIRALGGFFAMSLDTFVMMFRPPFPWRECLEQTWFVSRICMLPALLSVIPWTVLICSNLNFVLANLGAADYSGAADALATISDISPVSNVLVISGAAATAICADLGARTIREELDAMRVMGINPIKALAVPRVVATTTVTILLALPGAFVAIFIMFFFSVFFQHVSPGAFIDHLTLLMDIRNVGVSTFKSMVFGLTGGLIANYMGMTVRGGPDAVGRAVNETVVFSFIAMFVSNAVMDAITIPLLLI